MRHVASSLPGRISWRLAAAVPAVALLVAATAAEAPAAIALVQTVGTAGSQATGTTLTVTVPAGGVAADDTLIVAVAMDPASGPVSCDDTAGNTYAVDADVQNGSGTSGVRTVVLSALVTGALAPGDTITVTHPSVAARAVTVTEFSGVSILDESASATGNDTSPSSGDTAPTNQDDELLFGAIGMEAKKTDPFTPGAGYTGLVPEHSGSGGLSSSHVAINAVYQVVAVADSYAADGTIGGAAWAAAIATYRAVVCGNGVVEPGEDCDDGNFDSGDCCDPGCLFEDASTVCRDAVGDCDLPETCTGADPTCPPDEKSTEECRPAADDCDAAESCDGVGDDCPPDAFADADVVCRDAVGDCDLPETCTGEDPTCPPDEKSTDECRPAADDCDVAESCDGIGDDCPPDEVEPDGDGDGVCDPVDVCPTAPDELQDDGDADGLGDACDPCTNLLPVFVEKPRLKLGKLAAAGRSTLRLTGIITVPTEPAIDPASRGLRVLVQDVDGAPVVDVVVPGGVGWRVNAAQNVWDYRNPLGWQSIVGVKIRDTGAGSGRLRFQVVGRNGTYPISKPGLPVQVTIGIDVPYAGTGQCGEAFFPGRPGPACTLPRAGTALRCR
jgi:cysteine-rich repeat protein